MIKGLLSRNASSKGTSRADLLLGGGGLLLVAALFIWMFAFPSQWQQTAFMEFIRLTNTHFLAPEAIIAIVLLFSVVHVATSPTQTDRQDTWWPATLGVGIAGLCLISHLVLLYQVDGEWISRPVLHNMFQADLFSLLMRLLMVLGTFLVLLFTRTYVDKRMEVPGEFYVLLLTALLGGLLVSGATDLIMVFVALETLSISSYVMVGILRGNVLSAEAGLKYLLYGSMATAILLFGFSILYGLTGSTHFTEIREGLLTLPADVHPLLLAIMTVMIVGGIGFKLSAAPFHMWAPDVYEGAPTPVVAFLSVVSKIAGFALAVRLFYMVLGTGLEGWFGLLAVLAVVSMVLGNVVALVQSNMKRLLAYSTVAHVGYLLLGLVILTPAGLASLVFYLITYLFMNLGAFAVVTHFENTTGRQDIAAYAGLVRKRPMLVLIFSIMLLSLAGIPITAGFFAKFFLFQAVATAGPQHLWLVIIALLASTVSLYYYLNVIRLMVIVEPSETVQALPDTDQSPLTLLGINPTTLTMLICLYATLGLGIWAQPFMNLSLEAINQIRPTAFYSQHSQQHAPLSAIQATTTSLSTATTSSAVE